jgi:hypothetical protein
MNIQSDPTQFKESQRKSWDIVSEGGGKNGGGLLRMAPRVLVVD